MAVARGRKYSQVILTASRTVASGGTVATVGFPDIGLQGFAPKLARGEIASLSGAGDDPRYFQISVPVQPDNSGGYSSFCPQSCERSACQNELASPAPFRRVFHHDGFSAAGSDFL